MYMRQLDGVRCLALWLVLLAHWGVVPLTGYIGVRLFFVLSGFLVTASLLNDPRLGAYVGRRFLRIFPAFYLVVFVAWLAGDGRVLRDLIPIITYTGNWQEVLGTGGMGPGHFWSLYVEEQFYLVWPFLILFARRASVVPFVWVLIAFAVAFRFGLWVLDAPWQYGRLPQACLDTLGAGALLALAKDRVSVRFLRWGIPAFALCWAVPFIREGGLGIRDIGIAWGGAWLVWGASRGFEGWFGEILEHPVFVYMGRISYGVYLIHLFFVRWPLAEGLIVTFALSVLMFHFWEKPFIGLKRYLKARPDGDVQPHIQWSGAQATQQ